MKKLLIILLLLIPTMLVLAQADKMQDSTQISQVHEDNVPRKGLPDNKLFIPRSIRDFRLYNFDGSKIEFSKKSSYVSKEISDVNVSVIKIELPHDVFYVGPPLELTESRFPYANDYNYSGVILLNERSWVSGGGYHITIPTMGHITTGSAMYNRILTDKLLVSGGTAITKYALHGRQYSETVLSGRARYRFNNQMNLSLFGDYSVQRHDAGLGSLMDAMYPEMPGQMGYGFRPVSSAGLQLDYQVTNWLEFNPGLYAERYEFFSNHFSDYGLNGHLGVDLHERVRLHMRGRYSLRYNEGGSVVNKQMMYPQNMYGGGLEFKVNQTFSVEAGVTREINPWTGKWVTKPYIMPIFHIK